MRTIKVVTEVCMFCEKVTQQVAKEEKYGYTSLCRVCKKKQSGTKLFEELVEQKGVL